MRLTRNHVICTVLSLAALTITVSCSQSGEPLERTGDEIVVVDGEGGWYRVRLDHVDRSNAAGVILETRREVGEPAYVLSIGLGLLKNRGRFETFLEKAVELGVGEVIPLQTLRTEVAHLKMQRAGKVIVAAMKQSGRSRLVRLAEPQHLPRIIMARAAEEALVVRERLDRIIRELGGTPSGEAE